MLHSSRHPPSYLSSSRLWMISTQTDSVQTVFTYWREQHKGVERVVMAPSLSCCRQIHEHSIASPAANTYTHSYFSCNKITLLEISYQNHMGFLTATFCKLYNANFDQCFSFLTQFMPNIDIPTSRPLPKCLHITVTLES